MLRMLHMQHSWRPFSRAPSMATTPAAKRIAMTAIVMTSATRLNPARMP